MKVRWFVVWFLLPTEQKYVKPLAEYTVKVRTKFELYESVFVHFFATPQLYEAGATIGAGKWSTIQQVKPLNEYRTSAAKVQAWMKQNGKTLVK